MPKVLTNYIIKDNKIILLSSDMVFPDLPLAVIDYGREYKQPELIDTGTGMYEIFEHEDFEKIIKASEVQENKSKKEAKE